jgi:hypothetical protein
MIEVTRKSMATFVIPDPHERLDAVKAVLGLAPPDAKVVFLGDWFDTFKPYDEDRVYGVCGWLVNNVSNPRYTFLLGNHDVHYINTKYACSGFNPRTNAIVNAAVPHDMWRMFKVFTKVGPYLVSHAGFREETLPYAQEDQCADAIEGLIRQKPSPKEPYDPLFGAGRARGGTQPYGGPTWLDWNYEFYPMGEVPQIVGHTAGAKPRVKGLPGELDSHCIDTHSKHYAVVDDDEIKVCVL